MKIFENFVITVLVLFIFSKLEGALTLESGAMIFVLSGVYLLVSIGLKPLLLILALPATLITLGLFSLIVNTWLLQFADALTPGIKLHGFWNALLASFMIIALQRFMKNRNKETASCN